MPVPETDIVDDDALDEEATDSANDEPEPVTDNVGDPSVEINIEELLQTLESESPARLQDKGYGARHRLEELMESRRAKRDLEDFDDYIV